MSWRLALKVAVSAGLLGWLLGRSDISKIWDSVGHLDSLVVAAALAIYGVAVVLSAIKWRLLLPEHSVWTLAAVTVIGYFYSIVLPGQIAGEIVKTYRLGKGRMGAERIAASVVLDKITGLLALAALGVAGIHLTGVFIPRPIVVGLTIFLVAGFVLMISLASGSVYSLARRACRAAGRAVPSSPNLSRHLILFVDAWRDFLARPLTVAASIAMGVVLQSLYVAVIMMIASGIGIHMQIADWLWVFVVVSLAVLLPLSLGGIGIREGAFVGMLGYLGIPAELALALSLTLFGMQCVVACVGAVVDFSKIGKASAAR